jgi:hypothetical protein
VIYGRHTGRCLSKTGVFADSGGDFCRNRMRVSQFGSSETGAELQKPANSGLFSSLRGCSSGLGNAWLALQCRSRLSPHEFPAIREFNREFYDSEAYRDPFWCKKPLCCSHLSSNSLLELTGKLFRGTGIFNPITGNFTCNL